MEATERSVSKEEEEFPADVEKVLGAITRSSYSTADQIIKETSLSVGRVSRALRHLEKSNLVRRRVDDLFGVLYKLVPLDTKVPKTHEAVAAAALKSKVKQLYEDGFTYDEISEQLNIPRGTVGTTISRQVAKGEMKARGKGKRKDLSATEMTDEKPVSPNQDRSSTGAVSPKVQPTVQPKVLSCPKCDFVTKSYAGLHIHIGQKHQTAATVKQKLKAKKNEHAPDPPAKTEPLVTITLTMGEALETGIALAIADKIDETRFVNSHKIAGKVLEALAELIIDEAHLEAS